MSHDDKINYMKIAASILNIGFHRVDLDKLVCTYELIVKKYGNADLKDILEVEREAIKRDIDFQAAKAKEQKERMENIKTVPNQ